MKITFTSIKDFLELFVIWEKPGKEQEVEFCFYENTCYARHIVSNTVLVVKKCNFLREPIAEPVVFRFQFGKDFLDYLEECGNLNSLLFLEVKECISEMDGDENKSFLAIELSQKNMVLYKLPIVMEHSDIDDFPITEEIFGNQSYFQDIAKIESRDWDDLINQSYGSIEYQKGIIPVVDWSNTLDAKFDFCLNHLWYEGLTKTQAFSGGISANLKGDALVNKMSYQVPLNAIALSALILGKEDVTISDDCIYLKIATKKGAIVFTAKEPKNKVNDFERTFSFIFGADNISKNKIMSWLKPEGLVQFELDHTGLNLHQGQKSLKVVRTDICCDNTTIKFQAHLIKDALAVLKDRSIKIAIGERLIGNDEVYILSLSCEKQQIMILSCYQSYYLLEGDNQLLEHETNLATKHLSQNSNYLLKDKRAMTLKNLQNKEISGWAVLIHIFQNTYSYYQSIKYKGLDTENIMYAPGFWEVHTEFQACFNGQFDRLEQKIKENEESNINLRIGKEVFELVEKINILKQQDKDQAWTMQITSF